MTRIISETALEKVLSMTVPAATLGASISDFLTQRGKTAKVEGFRVGKVPLTHLYKRYGDQALSSALRQAIAQEMDTIVGERALARPVSYTVETDLSALDLNTLCDVELTLKAVFEPTIPDIDFSAITLPAITPITQNEDIDRILTQRASQIFVPEKLESPRPAQQGDMLIYTMVYRDAKGNAKEVKGQFRLGSGMLPPEFESALEGIEAGHVMNEKLKVPSHFPDKDLAGKKIDFSITFHEICQAVPATVDENFAKTQGFENLDALRQSVAKQLTSQCESMAQVLRHRLLTKELMSRCTFDVAESVVEDMATHLTRTAQRRLDAKSNPHNKDDDNEGALTSQTDEDAAPQDTSEHPNTSADTASLEALLDPQAAKEKARGLERIEAIVRKVIRQEQLSPSQDQLLSALYGIAQQENESIDTVIAFFRQHTDELEGLRNSLARQNALTWMCDQCTQQTQDMTMADLRTQLDQTAGV